MRHISGMNKLTPNLIVSSIETCLPFWVDRLGFKKTVEVPEGNRLGFVILRHGAIELMLQSRASVETDVAAIAAGPHRSVLYIEVTDLAAIRTALAGWPRAVPERTTSYGAREIIVRDPDGHVVFFGSHEGGA
jgi:catechol 2,3-dioxygenase-like lactoylglutathione lyase family enzyme